MIMKITYATYFKCIIPFNPYFEPASYCLHFMDEKTEAERIEVIFPEPQ